MAFTLSKAQRVQLADDLLEASIAPFREPVTLATLERRAEELRRRKVKGISDREFEATLKELENSIDASPKVASKTPARRIR